MESPVETRHAASPHGSLLIRERKLASRCGYKTSSSGQQFPIPKAWHQNQWAKSIFQSKDTQGGRFMGLMEKLRKAEEQGKYAARQAFERAKHFSEDTERRIRQKM